MSDVSLPGDLQHLDVAIAGRIDPIVHMAAPRGAPVWRTATGQAGGVAIRRGSGGR